MPCPDDEELCQTDMGGSGVSPSRQLNSSRSHSLPCKTPRQASCQVLSARTLRWGGSQLLDFRSLESWAVTLLT